MTDVTNNNPDFNKSHYLGKLGAVQLRKKIITFTQDVTFPIDVTQVRVTGLGGGAGGAGGGPGKAYLSSTGGPGASGGVGTTPQTVIANLTGLIVKCEIGAGGLGGAGGNQTFSLSTDGQPGGAGGHTKFIPYTPGGTYAIFYGGASTDSTRLSKPGLATGTTGGVAIPTLIRVPEMEVGSGKGGNTGAAGDDGQDNPFGFNGGQGGITWGGPNLVGTQGGSGGGGGAGLGNGGAGGIGGAYFVDATAWMIRFDSTTGVRNSLSGAGTAFNGNIQAIAVVASNKLVVGGNFTTFNGVSTKYIVKMANLSGTRDTSWPTASGVGFNNQVRAIAVDASGDLVVGGDFTSYFDGTTTTSKNRIMRLNNSNGTVITMSGVTTGFNGSVYAIAIQSDGKYLVAGAFTSYNGLANTKYLVRLNPNGSVDSTFNAGNVGANGAIWTVAVDSTGKIYIGGDFTTYNGLANKNRILRLLNTGNPLTDGEEDGTFDISASPVTNGGANGSVRSIIIDASDNVFIGGAFTSYRGVTRGRMVKTLSSGTVDSSFNIGTGFNGQVNSMQFQSSGKIMVVGGFTECNNFGQQRISRLNTDGTIDTPPTVARFASTINAGSVLVVSKEVSGAFYTGGDTNSTTYNLANLPGFNGSNGVSYGAGGGAGGGGQYFSKYNAPGGRGGNGFQGYMILEYFSKYE